MGFLSILGFFSKLSGGTASMSTSRQAWRLCTRLSLARMLGFTALVLLPLGFWTDRRLLRRRPPRPGMEVRHPGIALAGLTTLVLFAVTRA